MVLPEWDVPGRGGQAGTSQTRLSLLLPSHPGDLQEQGASVGKGSPSSWYLWVLTQVLVEPGGLRVPEGLGCGLLLSPSHLHPPATGLSGEQHSAPGLGGVCRRPTSPLCLCKRALFSQGGSGMKQESPQWTGSPKTWLGESGRPYPGVSGQTLVCSVGLHIFPGPRISPSARQPQPRAPCKWQ